MTREWVGGKWRRAFVICGIVIVVIIVGFISINGIICCLTAGACDSSVLDTDVAGVFDIVVCCSIAGCVDACGTDASCVVSNAVG